MARIAGVNIPLNKRVEVGLTYVFGIGRSTANEILKEAGVDPNTHVKDLTEDEVVKLREAIEAREVEGDLRRERSQNVKRLQEIGSYRGPAPPPRPAGAGPAHQDQRARPQGTATDEHRGQQEGRATRNGQQPKKSRRKVKQERHLRAGPHQDFVQQHDRHPDRHRGRRDRLGVRRQRRLQGLAQVARRSPPR